MQNIVKNNGVDALKEIKQLKKQLILDGIKAGLLELEASKKAGKKLQTLKDFLNKNK